MIEKKKIPEGYEIIEKSIQDFDNFAEIVGVTQYEVGGTYFVNLSFLAHKVDSYFDSNGKPAASNVVIKQVGSITMTRERAEILQKALSESLANKTKE